MTLAHTKYMNTARVAFFTDWLAKGIMTGLLREKSVGYANVRLLEGAL